MKVPITSIVADEQRRIRQDQGDLAALQDSIDKVGLLNPILIDENYHLVAGFRRLNACRNLGWTEVEVQIVPFKNDPLLRLDAEADENLVRKDFTVEEILAVEKRRQEILRMLRGNFFQRIWRRVRELWFGVFGKKSVRPVRRV